ncbi:MAG: CRISPR system precrRNA processing endoribonuclease RAMP protein Cas6 [Desulfobacula sp.]|nr:CRISPR system precrRNA processing endoribonuclease RAMP protein Cas6 [Desulfobacula sp.]
MEYGRYKFLCKFNSPAELPVYKGSTFRGVFGIALKNIICTFKNNECNVCLLQPHCIYALVFETHTAVSIPKESKLTSVPHPFVIVPPLTNQTRYQAGDPFVFHILLFGNINQKISYFIYALNQMGEIGIGKKQSQQRGKFELLKVETAGHTIYTASEQKINLKNKVVLNFSEDIKSSGNNITVSLNLETPLRLKFKNRLHADLPFHVLVRAILRRLSSLLECYGKGEPDIDYSGLVKRARKIKIIENNLKWFDWKRYSSRQKEKMLMGGITGTIIYKGELEEYIPMLEFCQKTHIGKQTAFGLGKFSIEVLK